MLDNTPPDQLTAGGTDWPKLSRKERGGKPSDPEQSTDLLEPHLLRSLFNVQTALYTPPAAAATLSVLTCMAKPGSLAAMAPPASASSHPL
ncbi:hypothetical protein APHAL10511_003354 [Amanita phalloides]|nr:hypothetical protein APHAL10511_003354 [Amanita phalloides]